LLPPAAVQEAADHGTPTAEMIYSDLSNNERLANIRVAQPPPKPMYNELKWHRPLLDGLRSTPCNGTPM
jgi:hypothetical protein